MSLNTMLAIIIALVMAAMGAFAALKHLRNPPDFQEVMDPNPVLCIDANKDMRLALGCPEPTPSPPPKK